MPVDAELGGRTLRPGGLAERRAGEEDDVGIAGGQDLLGLLRRGDETHGTGRQPGTLADGPCERDLVAGADGDLRQHRTAGGDVDEVDADTRRFYERHGFVNIEDGVDYRMLCYVGPTS